MAYRLISEGRATRYAITVLPAHLNPVIAVHKCAQEGGVPGVNRKQRQINGVRARSG